MYDISIDSAPTITFVMIDINGGEVTGLSGLLTVEVSKAGGAFASGVGAQAEIGDGWYSYNLDTTETDTVGALSVKVTGAGCIQQNLVYRVMSYEVGTIAFTYTLTDSVTLDPIPGATCWFATDAAGSHVIWSGITDTFGVARDTNGDLPRLMPGTYYIFRNKIGYIFTDPDVEVVS